jgi:hypothetical protein
MSAFIDSISNLRYDPFTQTFTPYGYGYGANAKEVHTIPSSSPYWIYLDEIPREDSPSTLFINEQGAGNFTEVSFTTSPAAGQFRVTYGGDGTTTQTTAGQGIVEFNSVDAGKIVEVKYYGLGNILQKQFINDFYETLSKNNLLINGYFEIAQRETSFTAATTPANNDDTYLLDRWILLSDGNDIVDVSQDSSTPDENGFSIKSLVATANKKWGFVQIIENKNCKHLQDEKVSLSFWAKTTTSKVIDNIRAAVISWDSTADSPTSDVVSAWAASGTNPTLVANWTYENTATDLALTTSWQQFEIENIDVDTSGMNNLAVFIWVDDVDASANDELFLAKVELIKRAGFENVEKRKYQEELILCQRYYEKSYDMDEFAGSTDAAGRLYFTINQLTSNNNREISLPVSFKVRKRTTPTVATFDNLGNGGSGAGAKCTNPDGNNETCTLSGVGEWGFLAYTTYGAAPQTFMSIALQMYADAEL